MLLLTLQVFNDASAQDSKTHPTEPKTKLEAFQAKSGTIIIEATSNVGETQGDERGISVRILSKEFTDASSGKKEYGIEVNVKGYVSRGPVSYID